MLVPGLFEASGASDALLDVKTLHYAPSTYPASEERCRAVTLRAAAVHGEYVRKARALDARWFPDDAPDEGPVARRLRQYGAVQGLVFGSFAEASDAVDRLACYAAEVGAGRARCDAFEPDDVRDRLLAAMRRRWGVAAARANARLLLTRLGAIGRGAGAAEDRRLAQRRRSSLLGAAPRLWLSR